jgi:enediyne biosynthesis protein E4
VGAKITVTAGSLVLTDEVHSGRGYQSHYLSNPHFGLGSNSKVDRIEVRWPGGGTNVLHGIPANQSVEVIQRIQSD